MAKADGDHKDLEREIWQLKALLRNLNLLVLDVFKEIDTVIEKMMVQPASQKDSQQAASEASPARGIKMSPEALSSLTQLLSFEEIEKKQL